MPIDATSARAYLARPWDQLAARKAAHWAARKRRGGLAEVMRVATALRDHAKLVDPTWPSEHDRGEDLQTHQRVAQALACTTARSARRVRRRR